MELPITTDIRNTKTKDIGNFSFLQAAFIAAGVGTGIATWKITNSYEFAFVPAFLILIVGFFKPFGMPMWTFFKLFVREKILTPKNLIYEDDYEYDEDNTKLLQEDGYDVSEVEYAIQAAPQKYKWSKEEKQRIAL